MQADKYKKMRKFLKLLKRFLKWFFRKKRPEPKPDDEVVASGATPLPRYIADKYKRRG